MKVCPVLANVIAQHGQEAVLSLSGGILSSAFGDLAMEVYTVDALRPWCHVHGTTRLGHTAVCQNAAINARGTLSVWVADRNVRLRAPEPLPDLMLLDAWETE